jgi:hypothetical protein
MAVSASLRSAWVLRAACFSPVPALACVAVLLASGSAGCAAPARMGQRWSAPRTAATGQAWPAATPTQGPPAVAPPPAAAAAAPAHRGFCTSEFQAQFGWPDPEKAARVCQCESRGNPRALSRNGLYAGLFQFSVESWRRTGGGDVFDPWANSAQAYRLFARKGWRPWPTCGRE